MSATKPVRKPDISAKDIGEETLLHDSNNEAIHVLNPTAQLIWDLCDGNHTPAEMESIIRAKFAVPEEHDLLNDIHRTLDTFSSKGLLQSDSGV